MTNLLQNKTARNINRGDTVLGISFLEVTVLFITFQLAEVLFGLGTAAITVLTAHLGLYWLKRRHADGFLMHLGHYCYWPRIIPAITSQGNPELSHGGEHIGESAG